MQFLNHCEITLVYDWSRRRRSESMLYVPFDTQPKLEILDWTNSWQWSSLKKDIIRYKQNGRDLYCMPAGEERVYRNGTAQNFLI